MHTFIFFFTFLSLVLFETLLQQKVGGENSSPLSLAVLLALQWYSCHNLLSQISNACTAVVLWIRPPGIRHPKVSVVFWHFSLQTPLVRADTTQGQYSGFCKFCLCVISCTMDYIAHGVLLFWLCYLSNIAVRSASNVIHLKIEQIFFNALCLWYIWNWTDLLQCFLPEKLSPTNNVRC